MAGFDIPDNDTAFAAAQSIWMSADIDILTAGAAGVGVITGCGVTAQGSPDMTVAIAAGVIRIADLTWVAVTSGNGTITTADSTNPRIDLISVSNSGTKTVTAGTAAANPKSPDLPSGHIALAMVYVPANDTTIETDHITDKRFILPPDTLMYGTAFPTSPATGWRVARTDIDRSVYFYDGTRWLSETVYEMVAYTVNITVTTDTGFYASSANAASSQWHIDYRVMYQVSTTHSSTQYWTIQLFDAATGAIDALFTTSKSGTGMQSSGPTAIGQVRPSSALGFYVHATKVSTPGPLLFSYIVRYRRIAT